MGVTDAFAAILIGDEALLDGRPRGCINGRRVKRGQQRAQRRGRVAAPPTTATTAAADAAAAPGGRAPAAGNILLPLWGRCYTQWPVAGAAPPSRTRAGWPHATAYAAGRVVVPVGARLAAAATRRARRRPPPGAGCHCCECGRDRQRWRWRRRPARRGRTTQRVLDGAQPGPVGPTGLPTATLPAAAVDGGGGGAPRWGPPGSRSGRCRGGVDATAAACQQTTIAAA